MTDNEFVLFYKSSTELTPPSELKTKILFRASAEMKKKKAREKNFSLATISKKLMPLAACLAFVFILLGVMLGLGSEKYQTIYIDVNPSVELNVNRFGSVSGVEYLNEDAKSALDGVKLKGLSAEEALEKMINAYDGAGYFSEDAEIYISVVSGNNKNADKLCEKLSDRAEKIKGDKKYSVNTSKLTVEDRTQAEEHDISPGKYLLISGIIEEHPNYTVEDLKDKSMAELKALLNEGKEKNKRKQ